MDEDQYKFEMSELRRKLNLMSEQVKVYEGEITKLKDENKILLAKLTSAEKDQQNIRTIMTNNITQSNERNQSLLSEISDLKKEIRKLRD